VTAATDRRRLGFASALQSLRAAQKPARGTAAYSRHVNRPAGRVVAAAASTRGMTPNQATVISATCSGVAILLLATVEPGWALTIAVPLLLAVGYVWDSVDGQLARLYGGGSRSGEWLDHTIDCFKTSSLHLAVLISWYRFPVADDAAVLLIPLGFSLVATVTFFGLILMPTLRPKGTATSTPTGENPLRRWLLLPMDYGVLCLAFFTLAWPTVFLAVYTFLFAANAAALAVALRKWWRELRALDVDLRAE